MTECNIVINEYELYEKYPLKLIAKHVFEELKELFEPLDYKFTVSVSDVSECMQILFEMWQSRDKSVKISDFDIYKQPNSNTFMWVCSKRIPLFMPNSDQAIPLVEQLKNYFKNIENILNDAIKPISIRVNVVQATKNIIDFYRVNLRCGDRSDDDNYDSSEALSLKMSNYRRQLNERLQNSHGEMHATSETVALRVSPSTYKRMCKCVNVNELYCLKLMHQTDDDIPYWFECEVEGAKDIEEYAMNVKKCTVNGIEYDCLFIDDNDDIFSYFIGNARQKEAVPCVSKYIHSNYTHRPMYVLYNVSNEVQTFKIENDNASTYIVELMFADNGSDVFECYYRTDKVCCGPDPACDKLNVTRYKVNVVVDESDEEDDEC